MPGPGSTPGAPRNKFAETKMAFSGSYRGPKREAEPVDPDAAGDDANPPTDEDPDAAFDDPSPPTDDAVSAKVEVHFDPARVLETTVDIHERRGTLRVEDDGTNSLQPDFPWAAAPFPSAKRRAPKVWLAERSRVWGWKGEGPIVPTLVFEWQPPIVSAARNNQVSEMMIGGDGSLRVRALTIGGLAVGRDGSAPPAPTASAPPLLALPTFRIKGKNPRDAAAMDELLTATIRDVIAANPTEGSARMLSPAAWKRISEILMFHESGGRHFDDKVGRAVFRERVPYQCHGIQSGMPKFGAPSGYGIGQHDPPRSLQDLWNFYDHVRLGVELLMVKQYGKGAYSYLNGLRALDPANAFDRAVFLREMVRRYNGCCEVVLENGKWKLAPFAPATRKHPSPSAVSEKRVPYVNLALHTPDIRYPEVVKSQLTGAAATAELARLAGTMSAYL